MSAAFAQEPDRDTVEALLADRAAAHGASLSMLRCVVEKESRFKPSARGRQGEYGLAQWLPGRDNAWDYSTAAKNGINIGREYDNGNPDAAYYDADSLAELFARGRAWRHQHWPNTIKGCE